MKTLAQLALGLLWAGAALTQPAPPPEPDQEPAQIIAPIWPGLPISGSLRLQLDQYSANASGPLQLANRLQSGLLPTSERAATLQAELRSSARYWNATATLQQQVDEGQGGASRAWFNELAATHEAAGWQLSAGKKIVAWDVAYAFRPNDVVQQEERRTLVSTTAEGRPLLMAEHFDADTAWSLVWVNPTQSSVTLGAKEPALAARVYQRAGAVDWHGFARYGAHTGSSLGLAGAWVASDALELHASVRAMRAADSKTLDPGLSGLAQSTPWQWVNTGAATQALLGGTWTHQSQFSVLAEAWWDGTAPSDAQWRNWFARNQALSDLAAMGAPASAVAGNLAWQAEALSTTGSLRRSNVYLRLSWEHENWQPSLDLLYHPADGGRLWTAALLYKGDRVRLQGGFRISTGAADAVLGQLPVARQAYLSGTWTF
ncbi:MAG: hypothetical protein IPN53_03200 [Comamonadaceae bacterium]|nr:hypothetical protein [Comamonadaceae bacterium]